MNDFSDLIQLLFDKSNRSITVFESIDNELISLYIRVNVLLLHLIHEANENLILFDLHSWAYKMIVSYSVRLDVKLLHFIEVIHGFLQVLILATIFNDDVEGYLGGLDPLFDHQVIKVVHFLIFFKEQKQVN